MRLKLGIALVWCLFVSADNLAQDWTVWLYQPDDGLLLNLDAEGDVLSTWILPTDDGYTAPHTVIFSNDQTLMATVARGETDYRQRLTLYDVVSETVQQTVELPATDGLVFNADDRLIVVDHAFSYDDRYLAFVSFIGGIGWTIDVIDTASGDMAYSLSYDHAQVLQQPYLTSADIPQVVYLYDETLSFYIENTDSNPSPQGHSYVWFLDTDQVRETIAFPNGHHDTLATGEAVYPLPDNRFLFDNETIPIIRPHHNVVYVYQADDDIRFPSILRAELDLLQTWFIQGGERILVEAWEDDIRTRWLIYDRNGDEIRNMPKAGDDVTATRDGFLYLTELNDKTVLVHVESRSFKTAGDTVWVNDGTWQIVGVTDALSDNLLPFAQLDEGQSSPDPDLITLPPTPFPTPFPLVYIGREMQIQVLDDGYINLRDAPSTDSNVDALLENGLYVDIIDGPVESGIYTWWKVRLGNREGWLAEEVGGTQILIPRRTVEIDETEEDTDEGLPDENT